MAFATFSGPVRAGTVHTGSARNTGLVTLAQTYDSGDLTGLTSGSNRDATIVLPAGSQIINFTLDFITNAGTGTVTVTVGTSAGGTQYTSFSGVATGTGGRFAPATPTAAQLTAWQIGTADATLAIRAAISVGTMSTGRFLLTVEYVQRAPNGAQFPASV